jgi:hypothetical protein
MIVDVSWKLLHSLIELKSFSPSPNTFLKRSSKTLLKIIAAIANNTRIELMAIFSHPMMIDPFDNLKKHRNLSILKEFFVFVATFN